MGVIDSQYVIHKGIQTLGDGESKVISSLGYDSSISYGYDSSISYDRYRSRHA